MQTLWSCHRHLDRILYGRDVHGYGALRWQGSCRIYGCRRQHKDSTDRVLGSAHRSCCSGAHETAVCGFSSIVLTKRVPTCCASDLHNIIGRVSLNGHAGAWERKCCRHKAAQFFKKCPYYGYLLPKQNSGVYFRLLVRHHQDGLPRAESRYLPSNSRRDIGGYGDESENKANDPDEIHDG